MISAPRSSRSRCVTALTAPRVPTGMNAGVCTTPCGVAARRGARAVAVSDGETEKTGRTSLRAHSCQLVATHRCSARGSCYPSLRETTSRRRALRRPVGRARSVAGVGGGGLRATSIATRYEPVPIRIEKDGRWALADRPPTAMSAAEVIEQARLDAARPMRSGREVHLDRAAERRDHPLDRSHAGRGDDHGQAVVTGLNLDVIFPVLHGPYGEDGTIQGLLELANVPYVGAGVLASAVGMDKAVMKVVFVGARPAGLPVPGRAAARLGAAPSARSPATLEPALGFPMFVKPANLGSSVGISKAKTRAGLLDARWTSPARFDRKIVVEAAVPRRARDRMRRARQRRAGGVGARRGHPVARVLRLRSEVPRRRIEDRHPGGPRPAHGRRRSSGCRSRPSRPSTAPAWRASTSCCRAPRARSSSTR